MTKVLRLIKHQRGFFCDKKSQQSVLVHCKKAESTVTVAVQRAIMCRTWHPLRFCVYNYTEENDILFWTKQQQQLLAHGMFSYRQAEGDEILPTTKRFTFLMMFMHLTTV